MNAHAQQRDPYHSAHTIVYLCPDAFVHWCIGRNPRVSGVGYLVYLHFKAFLVIFHITIEANIGFLKL